MKYFTFKNIQASGIADALYTSKDVGRWGLNDPEALPNYVSLGEAFGIVPSSMVRTKQTHTTGIRVITAENAGEGVTRPITAEGYDGMITNVPRLMLCTVEADCTPVYLLDPVNKAIAMIHSGWKGTAGKISANAINLMQENYGTKPSDILAAIGPCICGDCYEVSDDLIPHFENSFNAEEVHDFFTPKPNGKYLLDLKKAVRSTLTGCGVPVENIEDSGHCTYHDGLFWSWRHDKDRTVRMLTAIMLK